MSVQYACKINGDTADTMSVNLLPAVAVHQLMVLELNVCDAASHLDPYEAEVVASAPASALAPAALLAPAPVLALALAPATALGLAWDLPPALTLA